MFTAAIAVMIAMQMSAMTTQPVSTESKPSNVASLQAKADTLDGKVEFWTRWSLVFVALTAVAAVSYGTAQSFLVNRQKLAARAHAELASVQDAELKIELKNKDLQILKLQAFQLPRRITMGARDEDGPERQRRFAEIRKYAGTKVLIITVPDLEARQLAFDIATALGPTYCNWRVQMKEASQIPFPVGLIDSGVRVYTVEDSPFGRGSSPVLRPITISKTAKSGMAIQHLLEMDLGPPYGPLFWGVHWEPVYDDPRVSSVIFRHGLRFPRGTVLITVGLKPTESVGSDVAQTIHNSKNQK
jgi:hypothetical protein